MNKLILLRHGQSQWNLENRFTGWKDVPLTDQGKKEAKKAGQLLKKNNVKIDVVFSSVLQRANKTAEITLKQTSLEHLWTDENLNMIKNESLKDVVERVGSYYEKNIQPLINEKKNVIIVAHGNSLRATMIQVGLYKPEEISNIELPTGSPFCIVFTNSKLEDSFYLS